MSDSGEKGLKIAHKRFGAYGSKYGCEKSVQERTEKNGVVCRCDSLVLIVKFTLSKLVFCV